MKIALFTLESAASAEATLQFARWLGPRLVLVGHSSPWRAGRALGRALRAGGPGLLPYLLVNQALPSAAGMLRRQGTLSALCREARIPALRLGSPAAMQAALRDSGAELLVSFHLDRILDAATLAVPRLGAINIHPSLLPRHRGPIPTFHGLAEAATGVSIHRMVPRIDAGGIWAQQTLQMPPGTTASAAARLLHLAAVPMLPPVLSRIAAGETPPPPPPTLPYRGWPAGAERRAAGVRLLDARDIAAAWRTPAGGWGR